MYTNLHPEKIAGVKKVLGKRKKKAAPKGQMMAKLAERVYAERVGGR